MNSALTLYLHSGEILAMRVLAEYRQTENAPRISPPHSLFFEGCAASILILLMGKCFSLSQLQNSTQPVT